MYVGVPPLYKLEVGKKAVYCYNEEELKAARADLAPGSYHIQRFKVRWGAERLRSSSFCAVWMWVMVWVWV